MDTEGKFYLGRFFDVNAKKVNPDPLLYSLDDLTTHAVILGMTGSGKTGLCIGLMEEAALQGIPAILIDPKGDLTNLLLHFPALAPGDFQPWLDADTLRRQGKTEEYMSLLAASFNPATVEGLMCRTTLSVGWMGEVYDCDFNQMLRMQMQNGKPLYLWDVTPELLEGWAVRTGPHCLACTAGYGSSCSGALQIIGT